MKVIDGRFVYYYSIKRKLNKRLIHECRCDERLKAKDEGSTHIHWVTRRFLFKTKNKKKGNAFAYDPFGDHLQTCQTQSAASQVHDWVVYKLVTLLGSVGHRVKIHNNYTCNGQGTR